MDRKRLENQLIIDEGKRLTVYRDSLGFPTVGIGHLVTLQDDLVVGDTIDEERCASLFNVDVDAAIAKCEKFLNDSYHGQPDTVQEVLVNMTFNMGIGGLMQFRHFLTALAGKYYQRAADELVSSKWHTQVGERAQRIEVVIRNAGVEDA